MGHTVILQGEEIKTAAEKMLAYTKKHIPEDTCICHTYEGRKITVDGKAGAVTNL